LSITFTTASYLKNKSYTELELIQNLKQILTLNSVDKGTEKPKSLDLKPMQDIKTDIETIKKCCVKNKKPMITHINHSSTIKSPFFISFSKFMEYNSFSSVST
jgi:hypothetical protein